MIEAVGMTYFRLKSVGKVGAPTYSYENVSSIKDNYIEANKILMYLYGYKNYYLKNKAKFISN